MFRRAVNIADNIDIWVSKTFNLEPKHRLLVVAQDTITRRHLQNTIGKAGVLYFDSHNKDALKKLINDNCFDYKKYKILKKILKTKNI